MEMSEAQGQFGLADDFFNKGRYAEAIGVLEGLEPHFPNNHRLLNAKARTLAEMGKLQPALEIFQPLQVIRKELVFHLRYAIPSGEYERLTCD